jgi:hypothetical protein
LPNRAAGARVRGSRRAGEGRSPSTGVRVRLVAVGEEREGMQSPADLIRRAPAPDFLVLSSPCAPQSGAVKRYALTRVRRK